MTLIGLLAVSAVLVAESGTRAQAQTVIYDTTGGFSTGVDDAASSVPVLQGGYGVTFQPVHVSQSGDGITELKIIGVHGTKDSGTFVETDPALSSYTANIFSSMDAAKANPFAGDIAQLNSVTIGEYGPAFGLDYKTFTFTAAQPIKVSNDFVVSVYSTSIPFIGDLSWSLTGDPSSERAVFLSAGPQNGFVFPQGAALKITGNQGIPAVPELSTPVYMGIGLLMLGAYATLRNVRPKLARRAPSES